MSYMFSFGDSVGLDDLVRLYAETTRKQVHHIVDEHLDALKCSFEVALEITIPPRPQPPNTAVWMLFFGLVRAVAQEHGGLEAGLAFVQLERMGMQAAENELLQIADAEAKLRQARIALAAKLLAALTESNLDRRATIEDLRETGVYPGRTPPDFDIFDHM